MQIWNNTKGWYDYLYNYHVNTPILQQLTDAGNDLIQPQSVETLTTIAVSTALPNKLAGITSGVAGRVGSIAPIATVAEIEGLYIYRAVSLAELDDIAQFGIRNKAGAYETGKLFALTLEEAAQFGKNNFRFDGLPNTIIKVKVPNSIFDKATKFRADRMDAISIPTEQLQFLKATPLNYSPLPPLKYSPIIGN